MTTKRSTAPRSSIRGPRHRWGTRRPRRRPFLSPCIRSSSSSICSSKCTRPSHHRAVSLIFLSFSYLFLIFFLSLSLIIFDAPIFARALVISATSTPCPSPPRRRYFTRTRSRVRGSSGECSLCSDYCESRISRSRTVENTRPGELYREQSRNALCRARNRRIRIPRTDVSLASSLRNNDDHFDAILRLSASSRFRIGDFSSVLPR